MIRTARWPLVVACLAVGVAVGRWFGTPDAQGQADPFVRDPLSYRDVVKRVLPAVVSIDAKAKPKKNGVKPAPKPKAEMPADVPEEYRKFFEEFQRKQQEEPESPNLGLGSGFLLDAKGLIVTNHHVVEGADFVEVTMTDGRKFTTTDIKSDANSDLAIIRVKSDEALPFLAFGDSLQMDIGDRVLAVGAPFGLSGSVTHGIISAKSRDLKLNRRQADDFLQTDAAINPGNSGGPLVNMQGQVIGVNSAIKSRSGGFQGIGLAITSNQARNVVRQLQSDGKVRRGYLGIEMVRDLTPEAAIRMGMKGGQGIFIARVMENSPAAKAGMLAEDAILSIDGKSVRENRELQRVVASLPLNEAVVVEVLRDGQPVKLSLTLLQEPDGYANRKVPSPRMPRDGVVVSEMKAFGMDLTDLTAERAEALGLNQVGGAIITRVERDTSASEIGLARGYVISKVDRKAVANAEEAKAAIEKADPKVGALLHILSPTGGVEILVIKPTLK